MSLLGGVELASLLTKVKVDIDGFKSDMEKVKAEAVSKTRAISKEMSSTVKVGEQMSKLGGKMTKALTLPIVGAGTAITKMAVDYETSFAKVSTLLDKNVVDYDKYKNDILDASSESKVAVDEFSEAVYSSISAGVDQTKAIQFTTDAMKLAKGGFTDGAKAVDVMTTAINAYSLSADDATMVADLLITTQNLGKTTVDELASSMGKVIPTANAFNVDLKNVTTALASLTKNGIATAEATTYFNAMLNDLGSSGTEADKALRELSGKGFAQLMKDGVPLTDILMMIEKQAEKSGKTLGDMFSREASKAALTIMQNDGMEYNSILMQMENSAGAAQEAFDKMDATPAEKLKGALNELKNSGIKLGTKLIPVVTKIADKISDLVDWFNELSPAQQESILKMGAMVAAAGPLLKITGGLVSGYGKLKPLLSGANTLLSKGLPLVGKLGSSLASHPGLIGKIGGALTGLMPAASGAAGAAGVGGLVSSLGSLAVSALPVVGAIGGVAAAGYGLYKCLSSEVIPEVDLFKDSVYATYDATTGAAELTTVKISEETKKQVQAYMDLSNSAQQESMNMYAGITEITDTSVASITGKVNDMSQSIITATNTQREEVMKGYQDMFANTTILTAQEQQEIMASVTKGYDDRIKKTNELRDELTGIYQQIADNGGTITQSQQERIDQIYEKMKEQAVQSMTENETEQNVILNRLGNNNEQITAEMVGNTIKQMNELRDKSIQSAAEKRDALVREAEKLKTVENGKYKDKADAIIKEANREYEGAVDAAEKLRTEGIDKVMYAHQDMADKISVNTGEVLTWWERLTGQYEKWDPKPKNVTINFKTFGLDMLKAANTIASKFHYNGLDYVPFDGYNARLHEGERVLTKKENEAYTQAKQNGSGIGRKLIVEVPLKINDREFAHATKEAYMEELGFAMEG